MPLTQDKIKKEDEQAPVSSEQEQEEPSELESEEAISDFAEDCDSDMDEDQSEDLVEEEGESEEEETEEEKPEEESAPPDNPFMQLEEMRKDYSGFSKDQINEPDEADKEADSKTLETAADMEAENAGDLAENVGKLLGNEAVGEAIGNAIKGSYAVIKAIINKVKESKDKDEDQIAEEKSKWQKFKELVVEHKDKLFAIGEKIISKVPVLRSIMAAVKTVYKMVQFFVINSTRKRMVSNRRKFKEKYRDKQDKDGKYVEKSSGFVSWAKRKIGVKKTDETVNKELLEKKYKGGPGTRQALDSSETKDIRQYLIDDRLMKLNKDRQIKKGKDAAFDGLDTTVNIMKDVSFFASMGASEAGMAALDAASEGIEMGKGMAEKAVSLVELKMTPQQMKDAVDYTGILLEHIGGMTPFNTEMETIDEFDHVDSDIDATGVDKQELYKNNGKKKEQKKLLIEALAE